MAVRMAVTAVPTTLVQLHYRPAVPLERGRANALVMPPVEEVLAGLKRQLGLPSALLKLAATRPLAQSLLSRHG